MKVISEVRTNRYSRSIIRNLDLDRVQTRLEELMEDERIFMSEDLTLATLSSRLEISPHQLSQLLNDTMNRSFSVFVNSYRIREAKQLLRTRHDLSILAIAYEVGFDSKSSFYDSFVKDTGSVSQGGPSDRSTLMPAGSFRSNICRIRTPLHSSSLLVVDTA